MMVWHAIKMQGAASLRRQTMVMGDLKNDGVRTELRGTIYNVMAYFRHDL